jgi:hypothetical protein
MATELLHWGTDRHDENYLELLLQIYLRRNQDRFVEISTILKVVIGGDGDGDAGTLYVCRYWESRGPRGH